MDWALIKLQQLICHKSKANQTNANSWTAIIWLSFKLESYYSNEIKQEFSQLVAVLVLLYN